MSRLVTVMLAILLVAMGAAACGEDDDDATTGAATETTATESGDSLPADVVADVEALCGELITEIGGLEAEGAELTDQIDLLQAGYVVDLKELGERVPESEREAWDAYVAAQEEAFAASPPPAGGEPQPELEEANAEAERQAAALGFSSCSGV